MNALEEKIEGTIHLLLYILKKLGGRSDVHKLFKILYFAEQKHLVKYGATISQDQYHAMKNGPVPSLAYDIYKSVKEGGASYARYFTAVDRFSIEGISEPDMDYLSESELKCIDESVLENKNLTFNALTDKSHDEAWTSTARDKEMDVIAIAKAGGADSHMIQYIEDNQLIQVARFE
ncbi:hypothetical protein GCM10010967_30570 [Dyadobacter beijingensis]|uniref:Antitoxin SocA-like Panacea domain-containing protein n=1 Tax=Dyadobacter beijingensis TaxID=365489 RepID=A0ABQ2HYA3_9BACT|nr:Panacea domain-containing protein [Dyadobacter beijingensis]GGM95072.1 hypothetical protein GCM10010967_30570 [Dyadobacter beijingensis]